MAGVGQKIEANDYNTIQTTISQVLGTNPAGYGQTVRSSQVATSSKITAAQWNALQADITAVNYHQLNTAPVYSGVALTTASTTVKIKDADRAAYLAVAQALLNTSPSTVGGVSYPGAHVVAPTGQNTSGSTNFPVSSSRNGSTKPWGGTGYETTITHTTTLTFANILAAEYFFNSGSVVTFTASATGGTTGTNGTKDYSWATLLTNMHTVTFSYSGTRGSGSGTGTSYGWSYFNANRGTSQTVFTNALSSGLYSPNQYDLVVSVDSTGTVYTFSCRFEDIGSSGSVDENVTATIQSDLNVTYASGPYVSVSSYLPAPAITVALTS
jgi:hypothetical protein